LSSGTRAAAAVFGGFALLAAVDACSIAVAIPLPAGGVDLRLAHLVYDAAETLGMGAVLAILVGSFVRFVRLDRRPLMGVAMGAALAVTYLVLKDYLPIFAAHLLDGRLVSVIYVVWLAGTAFALAAAPVIATQAASHRIFRFVPVPLAIVALGTDQLVLRDDYFDIHGIVALLAVLFGGAALAPSAERAGRALGRSLAGRVGLAAIALFALFGIVRAPSNAIRCQLFRQPCAIASWTLATLLWRSPGLHAPVKLPESPWLRDRSGAPPVPPTTPPLLPADAVVVLITIDALRADVVADPQNDRRFSTLARLKREGVVFTNASTPGASTEVSFASLFSSRYFSELEWTDYGTGWMRHPHPITDPSIRFPELLEAHGVATVNFAGIGFLGTGYGVVRGFREEKLMLHRKTSEPGFKLTAAMSERLRHPGDGPLFLCTHLIDSHAPYMSANPSDPDYTRYLAAVAMLDKQVGRILRILETSFGQRWALFVSADHGEAFGDHQTTEHGKTLYEELLHVPLIARSPLFAARTVDARVGLIDLAPTFLDLFGVETPATFDGQSLVPFLAGGTATLTRPLIAEGRLRQALTEPDGLKVIDDPRRKLVEVYDLAQDPGETRNVFDAEPERSDAALAELRGFFAAHAWREKGYETPYKP
jgi:arylsulfatase A-like enzyme